MSVIREGSLEAPTRNPLDWKSAEFNDESNLFSELERVFDICHGCRRCFSLCNAFPTLFDAIDDSESMELDTVDREVYWDVVDHCYLCDLCFMTKCPYVPPHEWQVDFPHLMLRAKIVGNKKGRPKLRDKVLSSTDTVGKLATMPVVAGLANTANRNTYFRSALGKALGVHPEAALPPFRRSKLQLEQAAQPRVEPSNSPAGKVALFATCYGRYNEAKMNEDLVSVLQHNGVEVRLIANEACCGMPKLEIGDMEYVERLKRRNMPMLDELARDGWSIIATIPSCTLMFKQELPILFPNDESVERVRDSIFDPFEYLMLLHRDGLLRTDFKNALGKVAYHVACHQRVQNFGMKTRDLLSLVPDTEMTVIERCSGHDGTYAVKQEFHEFAAKIVKPVARRVKQAEADHLVSDCILACNHIALHVEDSPLTAEHPISLIRHAYGI